MADFYPDSMEARAAWHVNWQLNLPTFATKYGITAGQQSSVAADKAWMSYWVASRNEAKVMNQQLSQYFNDIAGNDPTVDPPTLITWGFSFTAPPEVPPGIEFRVRELVRQIKGHSSYSEADGELLGIVPSGKSPEVEGDVAPALQVTAVIPYQVGVTGSMQGKDQIRIEYQRNGGSWTTVGFYTHLPVNVPITPQTPGQPESGLIRAQFVEENQPYGNYSVIYPIVIS